MRKILIIGIGAGNPEHITVQAINALNQVDVVFMMDKGQEKDDLIRLRKDICARYIKDRSYRFVEAADPRRDPSLPYDAAVRQWHEQRAEIYERLIGEELGEGQCGAFLVWGDPSLYDSTLRIIDQLIARGKVAFDHEVIPGITAVQALAAQHKIALNRIGRSVHITTGRKLTEGLPEGIDDVVVMLDGDCAFKALGDADMDIYWGAYLGTEDEILIAGDLRDVADRIVQRRAEARTRKGWVMDTYLLRKREA
jgi:precorrin-6A synthase